MTQPPADEAFFPDRSTRYGAYPVTPLPDRTWPDQILDRAPVWCSVDLRDGNQALVEPMNPATKLTFFKGLVDLGLKEIEVGFPSASTTEAEFIRLLVKEKAVPEDVTLQVLTPARGELIEETLRAVECLPRVIVHLYNSTSELQRRVVFQESRQGIVDLACRGTEQIRSWLDKNGQTGVTFQYSPESFTGTELDFAIEVVDAVADIWGPTPESKMIINLPATVEMSSPNVYADRVEAFGRGVRRRNQMILSVHPHNDRGTAVAAAELGLMAGAERVEGTLFGNGERTGNVDLVTLALNLMTQGVDPGLDFQDINRLVRLAESCTGLPVHPRHPYAGELVFTAFSGSHQDAIRKGMRAQAKAASRRWEVPYLPMDPADVGRGYDELIRVNSQSGKGGVAWVVEQAEGYSIPRRLQIEFQRSIQWEAESRSGEVDAPVIRKLFTDRYLKHKGPLCLVDGSWEIVSEGPSEWRVRVDIAKGGTVKRIEAAGNGAIDAFWIGLRKAFSLNLRLIDFSEQSLSAGSSSESVAFAELLDEEGLPWHGVGRDSSTVVAAFRAVVGAVNLALQPAERERVG
ncbi:MAG: 2-isopropylmalate synthase [bacterium TMED88]|nr:2-isopropylmalate synthase [Deltaproteobacteria bacterium]OUV26561.1 MAG: 2-isopropylmalate synthase [bacterium TMED88]